MLRRQGFTLIELLTVIAIIAVLAAIAFPVYSRAKDSAYRNSDLSNMNALRTALQLYRVDQGGYPPALLGYATLYDSGPLAGQIVPADKLRGFLYPRRVDSIRTLQPSYARAGLTATSPAVWPNADPRSVGSAPILDLNGDGAIDASDDFANARQAYGPEDGWATPNGVTNDADAAPHYYLVSGYDVALTDVPGGGQRVELRYALFWTQWGLTGGSLNDDPRQLGYEDPPESTVVTWNSFFRELQDGVPTHQKRDLVLFLGGSARPYDSNDVFNRSWRVMP